MGLVNVDCRRCGEPMWIEPTKDALWDFLPGSGEMKQLFGFVRAGIAHVWLCFGCGAFQPVQGRVKLSGAS